jgi:hypothetical protein
MMALAIAALRPGFAACCVQVRLASLAALWLTLLLFFYIRNRSNRQLEDNHPVARCYRHQWQKKAVFRHPKK